MLDRINCISWYQIRWPRWRDNTVALQTINARPIVFLALDHIWWPTRFSIENSLRSLMVSSLLSSGIFFLQRETVIYVSPPTNQPSFHTYFVLPHRVLLSTGRLNWRWFRRQGLGGVPIRLNEISDEFREMTSQHQLGRLPLSAPRNPLVRFNVPPRWEIIISVENGLDEVSSFFFMYTSRLDRKDIKSMTNDSNKMIHQKIGEQHIPPR